MKKLLYYSMLARIINLPSRQLENHPDQAEKRSSAWPRQAVAGRILVIGFIVAMATLATAFIGTGVKNALTPTGSHDFQWIPAKELLAGRNPYADFMQWKENGNEYTPPHFLNQSPSYPASVYVLLTPMAALDWPTAKLAWLCANLCLIVILLTGLQRVFPLRNNTLFVAIALLFLCSTPLRASLGAGQLNFLSLAAFIWAWHFAQTPGASNARISGLLLAVAWVKYSLTFPLTLLFICRGKWKPVIFASIIHAALTVAAAVQLGMWPHEFFLSSVQVVLMGDGTGFLNLVAISMKLKLPMIMAIAFIVATTAYIVRLLPRMQSEDDMLLMTFLGLFSCAVFYHHGYDFIVLLLCAWSIARKTVTGVPAIATVTLLVLAWVGQWLAHEIAPQLGTIGPIAANITDNLLVASFYCTLALVWRSLHVSPVLKKQPDSVALSF